MFHFTLPLFVSLSSFRLHLSLNSLSLPVYLSLCFPLALCWFICVSCVPVSVPRSLCVLCVPTEAVESSFIFLFSFLLDFPLLVLCFSCILDFGYQLVTKARFLLVNTVFVLHLGPFVKLLACKNHRKMYYLSIISVCKNYFPLGSATGADKAKPQ